MIFDGAQPSGEEIAAIALAFASLEPAEPQAERVSRWAMAGREYGDDVF